VVGEGLPERSEQFFEPVPVGSGERMLGGESLNDTRCDHDAD
jgi:hypothetical protein